MSALVVPAGLMALAVVIVVSGRRQFGRLWACCWAGWAVTFWVGMLYWRPAYWCGFAFVVAALVVEERVYRRAAKPPPVAPCLGVQRGCTPEYGCFCPPACACRCPECACDGRAAALVVVSP